MTNNLLISYGVGNRVAKLLDPLLFSSKDRVMFNN
jgi:hypothetical protein